jgi:uncharacterized protein (AIM24 family)
MSIDEQEQPLGLHLQRAGELLRNDDLVGAEQEVARALELGGAGDVRVRNLLGLVHFRAGRLAEARDIYEDLVAGDPEDPGLRLNLGLVELRLGRYQEAVSHLALVTEKEPRNQRARGYLGLALLRSGDLAGARRAFLEAGQGDLARQVEDRIAPGVVEELEGSALAVRHIAEDGLRAVEERELPFASVETERQGGGEDAGHSTDGGWQVRRAGEGAPIPGPMGGPMGMPAAVSTLRTPPHPIELLRVDLPVPVTEFATQRLVSRGVFGEPFGLTDRGLLIIRVDGQLSSRTAGAVLSTGQMTFEPLYRRERGQFTEDLFGGEADGLSQVSGKGLILVAPQGQRFTALSLQNDILYLREPAVYAFEDALHWENGRVPGGAGWYPLVQFRGNGRLVVRTTRPLVSVKVTPEDSTFVEPETLIGWIGHVSPRVLDELEEAPASYLECKGEGVLLLEEPAGPGILA